MFLSGQNTPAGGSVRATRTQRQKQADALNARFCHHSAHAVMQHALTAMGRVALVSSFGAESVVLLHMAALVNRATPILFIDTEMLFTETLVYQIEVAERLGLSNIRIVRAAGIAARDPDGTLHLADPDACCAFRKTAPLNAALGPFDGWMTGRKRFQGGQRAALPFFEVDPGTPRLKINPLAHWARIDARTYIEENRLPRHPLVARGYPSIGCAPCTSPVGVDEDPRAGRWRDQSKDECGIHFENGRLIRAGAKA